MIAQGRFTLLKTTLIDYPGKVAAAVFLPGCHLRCPYCHNPELVDPDYIARAAAADPCPYNSNADDFRSFLDHRAPRLGGVVFSGGEALLHPELPGLIRIVRDFNLPVKLDTAGLLPDRLESLLLEDAIAYAAVDLKTRPERYGELGWKSGDAGKLLQRTLDMLAASGIPFEVRTTVVPPLVDAAVLEALKPLASRAPAWFLQAYHPGITLNPEWGELKAPDESRLEDMVTEAGSPPGMQVR